MHYAWQQATKKGITMCFRPATVEIDEDAMAGAPGAPGIPGVPGAPAAPGVPTGN